MDKNKKCSASSIKLGKDKYKKKTTFCKNCYNKRRKKDNNTNPLIQIQQPKNDNVNAINNNRTLSVGAIFSDKTYLLSRMSN